MKSQGFFQTSQDGYSSHLIPHDFKGVPIRIFVLYRVPKREAYVGWVLKGLNNEMKSVTHGV